MPPSSPCAPLVGPSVSVADYAALACALDNPGVDSIVVTENITGCVGGMVGWLICGCVCLSLSVRVSLSV